MPAILITGGHSGIGLESLKTIAKDRTRTIILAGRSPDRMTEAADQIRRVAGARVLTLALDTASLASVRAAAARVSAMLESGEIESLQAIVCNAGGRAFGALSYSPEGYETTFAGNYLGHFLLVNLLADKLAENGRVIFTASGTHDPETADGRAVGGSVEPDALMLVNVGKSDDKPLSTGTLYATSKLCMILFAYELDRRFKKSGRRLASITFDPGSVSGTGFLRGAPPPLRVIAGSPFGKWLIRRIGGTVGSLEFSGASLAKLVVDPAYANGSGKYFGVKNETFGEKRSSTMSYDEKRAAKLWTDSKTLASLSDAEQSAILR